MLDEAIFTAPAHPNWGGTALIGPAGDLLGIGSLQLQHAVDKGQAQNINMIVPIDLLKPIFDDLLKFGRRNAPPRPWLGFYATEVEDRLVVVGLADRGPAKRADLRTGDIVLAVAGKEVSDLASLFRRIWAQGQAGVEVPITDLSRRRDHGPARQVERAQPLPQGAKSALDQRRAFAKPASRHALLCKERAQAFAIGRIAQRHAKLALELVVVHAAAFLPEAFRHRRHRWRGFLEADFRRRAAPNSCAAKASGSPGGVGSSSATLKMPRARCANAASIACAMSSTWMRLNTWPGLTMRRASPRAIWTSAFRPGP